MRDNRSLEGLKQALVCVRYLLTQNHKTESSLAVEVIVKYSLLLQKMQDFKERNIVRSVRENTCSSSLMVKKRILKISDIRPVYSLNLLVAPDHIFM